MIALLLFPQAEELSISGFCSQSDMKMHEMDRRFGVVSAVIRALYWTVMVKRKQPKYKDFGLHSNPHLWPWVLGSGQKNELVDTSSWNEIPLVGDWAHGRESFKLKGANWGGSGIWSGCLMVTSLEVFLARPTGKGVRPRLCWSNYISLLDWECLVIPQEKLKSVAGEGYVWHTPLNLLSPWTKHG